MVDMPRLSFGNTSSNGANEEMIPTSLHIEFRDINIGSTHMFNESI